MYETRSIRHSLFAAGVAATLVLGSLAGRTGPAWAEEHEKLISCSMDFSAESWAFLVSKGHGEGHIRCDNGQQADAVIEAESVGIEFGEMKVDHGKATFADLRDIDEAFGRYVASDAAAAAGDTAAAGGLLKVGSKVKLGFYATGEGGGGIARSWGVVTIERKD